MIFGYLVVEFTNQLIEELKIELEFFRKIVLSQTTWGTLEEIKFKKKISFSKGIKYLKKFFFSCMGQTIFFYILGRKKI